MNKKTAILITSVGLLCLAGYPLGLAFAQSIPNPVGGVNSFPQLLTNIAKGVSVLIGSLATIMIIWAGILYLTSGGNPQKTQTAKTALIYAVIGIVIALAAFSISQIILGILKGS